MRKSLLAICLSALALVLPFSQATAAETAEAPHGDAERGATLTATCVACHAEDGNSIIPANPKLAGLGERYLFKQMQEFKSGVRENAIMAPMVAALSDQDMLDLAAYYDAQERTPGTAADDGSLDMARNIYRGGIANPKIASCQACHGPSGAGNPAAGYPPLSGQHAEYVVITLNEFVTGTRANDENAMMRNEVHRLTQAEIKALANYVQGLSGQ